MPLPPLVALILSIALVGFLVWVVVTYIPMPELIRRALIAAVVIVIIVWLLNWLGVLA